MDNSNPCAICKQSVNKDGIAVTHKGIERVNRASQARGDTILTAPGDMVPTDCRLIIAARVVFKKSRG